MKVLMFGWEFPPHISGGLGTACAGLTSALEEADVEVLFVIPKLRGGEKAHGTTFINASSIPIRERRMIANDGDSSPSPLDDAPYYQSRENIISKTGGRRITLEVPALLTPYQAPSKTVSAGLEKWNYTIGTRLDDTTSTQRPPVPTERVDRVPRFQYVKEPYQFSGTYGPNLLEEVDRYARAAAEIARHNEFDVIHAHDWMTYPAGMTASKISGKPLIVHVHATEVDRSGSGLNSQVFAIEKQGMQYADKVVTVSNWIKNIAIRHYDVPGHKIEVVHNGISPRANREIPVSNVPPLGGPIVTFLGRITHQKGPMYFVEAARKVHEIFPEAHFIVAGSGDQLPQMIERIARARLSEYFHFTGFLLGEDIDRIWKMSSVYVMPSVSEPFGIAPLEAIQAGVPVIFSNQTGVSEVMPHAIKVDFWNSDALAEAVCNVLRYESLANTLKKNGAEQIKEITWDNAAKKLTALYHELSSHDKQGKESDILLPGPPTKTIENAPVP